jgi:hypothetical protein
VAVDDARQQEGDHLGSKVQSQFLAILGEQMAIFFTSNIITISYALMTTFWVKLTNKFANFGHENVDKIATCLDPFNPFHYLSHECWHNNDLKGYWNTKFSDPYSRTTINL